eukprot:comp20558_c0_seq1/m.26399 comp20558_c0_seq1/g.26399  ORF comp20558_c0_seq1/g.26399 comp20558_c0_seq1/m.26399 type:complete len:384 (-) comp20558_c0_seq1:454-1605(-)
MASTEGTKTVLLKLADEYVSNLLRQIFQCRSMWKVVEDASEPHDLEWVEYEDIDWDKVLQGKVGASSFCTRKGLIRKAQLAHNLHKYRVKHVGCLVEKHVPETHYLEVDDPDYLDEALYDVPEVERMEPGSERWILKPSVTNQAAGVTIFDSVEGLQEAVEANPDLRQWVVQRYIEDPMLVNGRKFHLRVYAVVVGRMDVYLHEDILALCAHMPYDSEDHTNQYAHLTNTCLQEKNKDFDPDSCIFRLTELPAILAQQGYKGADTFVKDVLSVMRPLTAEIFTAVSSELDYQPLPNCFELYGLDFMLNAEGHLYFLEANASPDMKMTGTRLKDLVGNFLEEVATVAVDKVYGSEPTEKTAKGQLRLIHSTKQRMEGAPQMTLH